MRLAIGVLIKKYSEIFNKRINEVGNRCVNKEIFRNIYQNDK